MKKTNKKNSKNILIALFAMLAIGLVACDDDNDDGEPDYGDFDCGTSITFTYRGQDVTYGTVLRGGLCWFDRNLGASGVATSANDTQGFGDLFQWGRSDDGHQDRQSNTTDGPVDTDTPGHGDFITAYHHSNWDWRFPHNDNLWQGVGSINNPCPPGWRIPTESELQAEVQSWSSENIDGGFASPLKWSLTGTRNHEGVAFDIGKYGLVWSSTVNGPAVRILIYGDNEAGFHNYTRANGVSVRCVRSN